MKSEKRGLNVTVLSITLSIVSKHCFQALFRFYHFYHFTFCQTYSFIMAVNLFKEFIEFWDTENSYYKSLAFKFMFKLVETDLEDDSPLNIAIKEAQKDNDFCSYLAEIHRIISSPVMDLLWERSKFIKYGLLSEIFYEEAKKMFQEIEELKEKWAKYMISSNLYYLLFLLKVSTFFRYKVHLISVEYERKAEQEKNEINENISKFFKFKFVKICMRVDGIDEMIGG